MRSRLEEALRAKSPVRGATKLAETPRASSRRRFWRFAFAATTGALATLTVLLFGIPSEKEVSASEVLAQSLAASSELEGTELTSYELLLEGAARRLSPELADGTSLMEQLVDHDEAGRYRISCYRPDGVLLAELAQDPSLGLRTARLLGLGDRGYFFRFAMDEPPRVGVPELVRSLIQTGIAFLQASGDPKLTTFDVADGRRYQIELPRVTSEPSNVPWELPDARVIVDASDFRVLEFEASGSLFGQEGRVRYRLIHHEIRPAGEISSASFQIHPRPGDRELEGTATDTPARDVVRALLRALDAS